MTEGKHLPEGKTSGVALKRRITLVNGVSIIVGSIIGSGVFVSPGGVLQHAGSPFAAIVVWALSGIICTIGAVCFCELGCMLPSSGGEYTYALEAFGAPAAFVILWVNVVLIRPAAQAVVALACAEYAVALWFPACNPPKVAVILLAASVLVLLTTINCHSVRWAMRVQTIFTGAKLVALVSIILAGLIAIAKDGTGELTSAPIAHPDPHTGGAALAFYSGLFAYGGWNYLNFVTEELKNPERNLPLSICIGMPLVTVVYVLVNVAYLVVLPAEVVASSSTVAVDFGRKALGPLQYTVPVFVALSTFGSLNGILFTSGRLFYSAAMNKHMPPILSYIDVKASTPKPALITSCALSLCLLGLDIIPLINCLSFVLWLSIGMATAALLRLRMTKPNLPRPVKVPIILPLIFLFFCTYLVLVPLITAPKSTLLGVLMTLSAVPVYYFSTHSHSKQLLMATHKVSLNIQKLLTVVPPEVVKKDLLLTPLTQS